MLGSNYFGFGAAVRLARLLFTGYRYRNESVWPCNSEVSTNRGLLITGVPSEFSVDVIHHVAVLSLITDKSFESMVQGTLDKTNYAIKPLVTCLAPATNLPCD